MGGFAVCSKQKKGCGMKALACFFAALPVAGGCATSSPIQRYSESTSAFDPGPVLMSHHIAESDVYRIYQRGGSGFVSIPSLRKSVEKRAAEFCERQGKGMLVLGEKISEPPYILGNFPRIEMVFACVERVGVAAGAGGVGPTYQKLSDLKKLLDEGVLTREEFDREKAKVLGEQ
jgi:hypothetical protein